MLKGHRLLFKAFRPETREKLHAVGRVLPANPKRGLHPARAEAWHPELFWVGHSTQGQGLLSAVALVWPGQGAPGGQFLSVPHLKTRNSKAAGIARWRSHRHHEGTVRDVLLVELDGDLIVT